jgi:putative endonuclease
MHYIYILFSISLDRFYVGETENVENRLEQHNNHFFKGSETVKARDWLLKKSICVESRTEARKVETYIKSMKSKKFLESLCNDDGFYTAFKELVCSKYGIILY